MSCLERALSFSVCGPHLSPFSTAMEAAILSETPARREPNKNKKWLLEATGATSEYSTSKDKCYKLIASHTLFHLNLGSEILSARFSFCYNELISRHSVPIHKSF